MAHRLIASALFTLYLGCLTTPAAHGQYARARISRPSESAASTYLGRTGGVYTRLYGNPEALSTLGGGGWGGLTGRGLPAINRFGGARGFGRLPPAPIPQAFTMGQLGFRARAVPGEMVFSRGIVSDWQLREASLFHRSTGLWTPLTGVGPTHIQLSDQPYYAPEPRGTAFHEFFGLEFTPTETVPQTPPPFDSLAGILEQENERFANRMRSRGLQAFKEATALKVEDRGEALSGARRALTTVRDIDLEAYIPCLLLVHTALEMNQQELAVRQLADAVRRHPTVFSERPDVASYFGDPKLLEDQMRRHLRVGDESPDDPGAWAVQAYCAWVLKDPSRLREALDRLSAVNRETGADEKIEAIHFALAAAVQ